MHVAYIHQHFATPQGTTGTRSYEWSQRLLQAGHRVTMICGAYAYEPAAGVRTEGRIQEYEVAGIRVIRVAEPYGNEMGFARRVLAFGRFARAAGRIVPQLDADLVFATSTPLTVGVPGMKGARRLGVPFVFEVRDLWPEVPIQMGIIRNPMLVWYTRRLERSIYHAADAIIALAPGIQQGICETGYPADKVQMIPNCCDLELFRPSREPLQDERFGAPDDFRLVYTGAHGLANGLDAVLAAAAVLKRRGVRGVRFVFVGTGRQRDQLMALSRQEGLEEMVSWVPPLPKAELARILPRLDVGMMIFRNLPVLCRATSPNKFFDYIASGLPVLNNYPGWVAEMIQEHRCGVVVPPEDPTAFADAILRMQENCDELRQMGQRGRALAEARFSRDMLGEQFVRTLEEVFARRKGYERGAVSGRIGTAR